MAKTPLWQAYLSVFELPVFGWPSNQVETSLEEIWKLSRPVGTSQPAPPLDMLACQLDASLPGGCYASAHSICKRTHPQTLNSQQHHYTHLTYCPPTHSPVQVCPLYSVIRLYCKISLNIIPTYSFVTSVVVIFFSFFLFHFMFYISFCSFLSFLCVLHTLCLSIVTFLLTGHSFNFHKTEV